MERVSVDRAIRVGLLWVNTPVLIIMMMGGFAAILIVVAFGPDQSEPIVLFASLLGFAILWVLAWLWWSWTIPKWLVWAVERVDDWPQLRQRAIESKLIWAETTAPERLFARTAIWSLEQRQRFEAATQGRH